MEKVKEEKQCMHIEIIEEINALEEAVSRLEELTAKIKGEAYEKKGVPDTNISLPLAAFLKTSSSRIRDLNVRIHKAIENLDIALFQGN